MLAFNDDAALAHLLIAATAVPVEERGRWLQQIADQLDPPAAPSKAAQRQRTRKRRKARGLKVLPIEVPFVELSERLVDEGLVGEWDADNSEAVREALTQIVRSWLNHA